MDDAKLRNRIEELVAEERRLLAESVGRGPDDERHQRRERLARKDVASSWQALVGTPRLTSDG